MNGFLSSPLIEQKPLTARSAWVYVAGAIVCFHLAFSVASCVFLIVGFLWCLLQLTRLGTARQTFYMGLMTGFLIYAPQLSFFWNIFHAAAIPLWLVLSFWIGLFLLLARATLAMVPRSLAILIIPLLWLGLEYFRSELYYLRFSWLSLGYAFSSLERGTALGVLGVYGIGFVLALVAVLLSQRTRGLVISGVCLLILMVLTGRSANISSGKAGQLRISGVQLEFREEDAVAALERVHQKYPDTDLYVLSEYTFADPPPQTVMRWCRDRKTYLVAGAKDPLQGGDGKQFYNTAFIVGPGGDVVFKQVKSVPIQFFKDGLPAPKQELWTSPWGKIGICICYDLSYRRVVENLIAQGAELLIVPTMDVVEWGEHQHELHGRIAPMRASEYQVPVFRLCSSGISQAVDASGGVLASAPFPGQGEMLSAILPVRGDGRLPVDHWLAPFGAVISAGITLWLAVSKWFFKRSPKT